MHVSHDSPEKMTAIVVHGPVQALGLPCRQQTGWGEVGFGAKGWLHTRAGLGDRSLIKAPYPTPALHLALRSGQGL